MPAIYLSAVFCVGLIWLASEIAYTRGRFISSISEKMEQDVLKPIIVINIIIMVWLVP